MEVMNTAESIYASFGVNTATVGAGLSDYEKEMISQPTNVRDGDDVITTIETGDDELTEEPEEELQVEEEEDKVETSETEESETDDLEAELPTGTDGSELVSIEAQLAEQNETTNSLIAEAVEKGLDQSVIDAFNAEYAEGQISEKTYKALAEVGYSKAFIRAYVAGQEAVAQQFANSVIAFAGGQEAFAKVQAFMSANNADAVTAFNAAVDRADATSIKALINSTKSQMGKTYGNRPARTVAVKAAQPATVVNDGFKSTAEMVKAMSDRRYATDPGYRAEVERKVMIASF